MSELKSNLIILPGEEPAGEKTIPSPTDLVGRIMALNPSRVRFFQTFHFYLGPKVPFAQVPPDAALEDIHRALLDGRLLDATEMHNTGAVVEGGNQLSAVGVADTDDAPVFIGTARSVNGPVAGAHQLFVAIPKDKEEERRMREELATKGRIDGQYREVAPYGVAFTKITVSDIEEEPPIGTKPSPWKAFGKAFRQLVRDLRHWWSY